MISNSSETMSPVIPTIDYLDDRTRAARQARPSIKRTILLDKHDFRHDCTMEQVLTRPIHDGRRSPVVRACCSLRRREPTQKQTADKSFLRHHRRFPAVFIARLRSRRSIAFLFGCRRVWRHIFRRRAARRLVLQRHGLSRYESQRQRPRLAARRIRAKHGE